MSRLPESIFLHLCVLSLNVFLEMGLTNLPNANIPNANLPTESVLDKCVAFESSYHIDRACHCMVFESNGRSHGYFTSSGFPRAYPATLSCILYTFIGDLDEIVEISFTDFDLQVPQANKCIDYVKLYLDLDRPEVNEHHLSNYELCGNISGLHRKYYSSKRSLIVEFHTDSVQTNNTGFRADYAFLDKAQFEIDGGTKRWGTQCVFDFYSNKNSKRGSFFSPRYPQKYPPNSNCHYVFFGQKDERVIVTFNFLQLAYNERSCGLHQNYDHVIARDGTNLTGSGQILAEFCGRRSVGVVRSKNEQMIVEFKSDDSDEGQGFAATYQFLHKSHLDHLDPPPQQEKPSNTNPIPRSFKNRNLHNKNGDDNDDDDGDDDDDVVERVGDDNDKCEYEFISQFRSNGSFSSPLHPKSYPDKSKCRYIFRGQSHERIQIVFTEFELGRRAGPMTTSAECEDVDRLTVTVMLFGQIRNIGIFCGNKLPPMLMSNDNRLEFLFVSGSSSSSSSSSSSIGGGQGSMSAKRFAGHFSFVTNFGIKSGDQDLKKGCDFRYLSVKSRNGTFNSPNYPGRYPRSTECGYTFLGRKDERVVIEFLYFDVEGVPPSCLADTQSDYVEYSNFDKSLAMMDSARFGGLRLCGSRASQQPHQQLMKKLIISDANFFRVTFLSNDVYDATGFHATYHFRRSEEALSVGKRTQASSKKYWSGSGSRLSGLPGVIGISVLFGLVSVHRTRPNLFSILSLTVACARTIDSV